MLQFADLDVGSLGRMLRENYTSRPPASQNATKSPKKKLETKISRRVQATIEKV